MLCRHCRRSPVTRPRGLCWNCYYKPGVRDQYPRKFIAPVYRRNNAPPPPEPTNARPGSLEKIAVLKRRFFLRCQLWHPHDAKE